MKYYLPNRIITWINLKLSRNPIIKLSYGTTLRFIPLGNHFIKSFVMALTINRSSERCTITSDNLMFKMISQKQLNILKDNISFFTKYMKAYKAVFKWILLPRDR